MPYSTRALERSSRFDAPLDIYGLPNHIAGKAIIKEMRRRYPGLNMMTIDYDQGASEINQLNRIMLLTSVAHAGYDAGSAVSRQARRTTREKECIQTGSNN